MPRQFLLKIVISLTVSASAAAGIIDDPRDCASLLIYISSDHNRFSEGDYTRDPYQAIQRFRRLVLKQSQDKEIQPSMRAAYDPNGSSKSREKVARRVKGVEYIYENPQNEDPSRSVVTMGKVLKDGEIDDFISELNELRNWYLNKSGATVVDHVWPSGLWALGASAAPKAVLGKYFVWGVASDGPLQSVRRLTKHWGRHQFNKTISNISHSAISDEDWTYYSMNHGLTKQLTDVVLTGKINTSKDDGLGAFQIERQTTYDFGTWWMKLLAIGTYPKTASSTSVGLNVESKPFAIRPTYIDLAYFRDPLDGKRTLVQVARVTIDRGITFPDTQTENASEKVHGPLHAPIPESVGN